MYFLFFYVLTLSTKHSAMAAAWGLRSRSSKSSLQKKKKDSIQFFLHDKSISAHI